jgi:hypothetical protein
MSRLVRRFLKEVEDGYSVGICTNREHKILVEELYLHFRLWSAKFNHRKITRENFRRYIEKTLGVTKVSTRYGIQKECTVKAVPNVSM